MTPLLLAATMAMPQTPAAPVDVLRLPIGPNREVTVRPGWTDTRTGRTVTANAVAEAADGVSYLLVGESHDIRGHKVGTAEILQALHRRGREVVLGLEMFTRPNQQNMDPFTRGFWSEEQFIQRTNWQQEWGFDFSIYRPAFQAARDLRIPMVALNVPRAWVRAVGRGGPEALPEEARGQVPPIDTNNANHRMVFQALMGGHPTGGAQSDRIYAAQVLWDVGMADTAIKAMRRWPASSRRIMVILCGSGHAMYGQGINYRLKQQSGADSLTVIGITGTEPRPVRVGLGDFILMTPPEIQESAPSGR